MSTPAPTPTPAPEKPLRVSSPRAAGQFLQGLHHATTAEAFGLLAMKASGDVLAHIVLATGPGCSAQLAPREVFRRALAAGASMVLVYRWTAADDGRAAQHDETLTARLRASGEALGIILADFIVAGRASYHSFRAAQGWDHTTR